MIVCLSMAKIAVFSVRCLGKLRRRANFRRGAVRCRAGSAAAVGRRCSRIPGAAPCEFRTAVSGLRIIFRYLHGARSGRRQGAGERRAPILNDGGYEKKFVCGGHVADAGGRGGMLVGAGGGDASEGVLVFGNFVREPREELRGAGPGGRGPRGREDLDGRAGGATTSCSRR